MQSASLFEHLLAGREHLKALTMRPCLGRGLLGGTMPGGGLDTGETPARCLHRSRCSGGSCGRSRGTVCAMLQPVNDCYLSPKPRRDDVPVTRPITFSALPEMKHCEVPDSFHSLSTLFYAACAPCATLHSIRSPRHSAPAPLTAPSCATLRSLRYTAPRYAPCATTRPITVRPSPLIALA